jgi:hypothetical protein
MSTALARALEGPEMYQRQRRRQPPLPITLRDPMIIASAAPGRSTTSQPDAADSLRNQRPSSDAVTSRRTRTGQRCQCPPSSGGCGLYFSSAAAFDEHRAGVHGRSRHCRTVAEMSARRMRQNRAGFWCTSRSAREWGGARRQQAIRRRPLPEVPPISPGAGRHVVTGRQVAALPRTRRRHRGTRLAGNPG